MAGHCDSKLPPIKTKKGSSLSIGPTDLPPIDNYVFEKVAQSVQP